VIDDREKNDMVAATLRNSENITIEFGRLELGDYLLPNLLVERKSFADFCEGIKTGRIFQQARNLIQSKTQPLIIIEVESPLDRNRHLSLAVLQGAIITISVLFGIPILRSRSPEETARLILQTSRQIENFGCSIHRYGRLRPAKNSKSNKKKLQLHFLQGFPGIGPNKATALIEKYCTIRRIVNLTEQELSALSGFGRKLVKKMIDLLD
jgi:DNA excision repair protein ERCC-4